MNKNKTFILFGISIHCFLVCDTSTNNSFVQEQESICNQAEDLKKYSSTVKQYKELVAAIKTCRENPGACQRIMQFVSEAEQRQKQINSYTEQFARGEIEWLSYETHLYFAGFLYHDKLKTVTKNEASECLQCTRRLQDNIKVYEFVQEEQAKQKKALDTLKSSLNALGQKLSKKNN